MALAELQRLEREYAIPTYVRNQVEFVRGQGVNLWMPRASSTSTSWPGSRR